jgi:hypothetical protein
VFSSLHWRVSAGTSHWPKRSGSLQKDEAKIVSHPGRLHVSIVETKEIQKSIPSMKLDFPAPFLPTKGGKWVRKFLFHEKWDS